MEDNKFLKEQEEKFSNSMSKALWGISMILDKEDSDMPPYERVAYIIEDIADMARAFEQTQTTAHNLVEQKKKK